MKILDLISTLKKNNQIIDNLKDELKAASRAVDIYRNEAEKAYKKENQLREQIVWLDNRVEALENREHDLQITFDRRLREIANQSWASK